MYRITRKVGRIEITLDVKIIGDDYLITITGGEEHVGAVGVGQFDDKSQRASSSVITMSGHREDLLALNGARQVSKVTKKTTILVVGIHQDNISLQEIKGVVSASEEMIADFIAFREENDLIGRNG